MKLLIRLISFGFLSLILLTHPSLAEDNLIVNILENDAVHFNPDKPALDRKEYIFMITLFISKKYLSFLWLVLDISKVLW